MIRYVSFCFLILTLLTNCTNKLTFNNNEGSLDKKQNILLIILDDIGVGEFYGYSHGVIKPNMPNIKSLVDTGLSFDEAWAFPLCAPTRASISTGKYGFKNGVTGVDTNNIINSSEKLLHKYISESDSEYAIAHYGKWHISGNNAHAAPAFFGVTEFRGLINGAVLDYSSWQLSENGLVSTSADYITKKLTDLSIDFVNEQGSKPWFLWLAYTSPHTPFHLPPEGTHSQTNLSGDEEDIEASPRPYFNAMVENVDFEIGRLLNSMPTNIKENTTIILIGDNGSHKKVIQAPYTLNQSKGTLFQGGVHVPFIVSGKGVSRKNQRDSSLISSVDIFPTILELIGAFVPPQVDGVSFKSLLESGSPSIRKFNFSQISSTTPSESGMTIRNSRFKLIKFKTGNERLFDLQQDPFESTNLLLGSLNPEQKIAYDELSVELQNLLSLENEIDITDSIFTNRSPLCTEYVGVFSSQITDVNRNLVLQGQTSIIDYDVNHCKIFSNSIPNHNINDGANSFPNDVTSVSQEVVILKTPALVGSNTNLSLQYNNAIFLNGSKLDLLAAACYGVGPGPLGQEKIGCNNPSQPWRYDPMFPGNDFGTDSHNAHAQPNGSYHYHGNPNAMFVSGVESPVIGFAADGFPIYGSYINDGSVIREVQSGYTLKTGDRAPQAGEAAHPLGNYNGTFRDDYEFTNNGDLDECNGMTQNGQYAYYVTNFFPWVLNCYKGILDSSFQK